MTTTIISVLLFVYIQGMHTIYTCDKDGKKLQQTVKIMSDSCDKKYYSSGVLESITCYKNGKIDGWSKSYYQNGKPKTEVFFVMGKKTGEAKYYDQNSNIEMIIRYDNNGEREFLKKMVGGNDNMMEFYKNGKIYMTVFQKMEKGKIIVSDTVLRVSLPPPK